MQLPCLTLMIATWELYFSFLITNLEGEECCLQRKSDTCQSLGGLRDLLDQHPPNKGMGSRLPRGIPGQ